MIPENSEKILQIIFLQVDHNLNQKRIKVLKESFSCIFAPKNSDSHEGGC